MLGPIEDALNDQSHEAALVPAQRVRLQTAHHNSLRLLKLVNTLLDFSRIEAGRVEASYGKRIWRHSPRNSPPTSIPRPRRPAWAF
jgi:signal transduction histidine kinase